MSSTAPVLDRSSVPVGSVSTWIDTTDPDIDPHTVPIGSGLTRARSASVLVSRTRAAAQVILEYARVILWFSIYGFRLALIGRKKGREADVARSSLVRGLLLRMGPLYMKGGQVLATQSGLLPKHETDEFRSFFSELPPMSGRALTKILKSNYTVDVSQIFATFEKEPLAVGSVAQVHRATLKDGRAVAVKVVKQGVREELQASAWLIAKFLRIVTFLIPPLRQFELPEQFAEIRPLLVDQCDMPAEARTQIECAQNFARHPYVRVPAPILELCTNDVLVMEFMGGIPGQHPEQVNISRAELAQRLMDTFYSAVFFHGFYHVDPHPGNMLFGQDGTLQLLDFGLFGRMSEDEKWQIASFYYACIRKEWELAVQRLTRAFVPTMGTIPQNRAEYDKAMVEVLIHHFETQSANWSTIAFFDDCAKVLRRYGARVTTNFTLVSIGLLTGEGFVAQTDPDIDIWANARRFTDRFSPYMSQDVQERFEQTLAPKIATSMAHRDKARKFLVAPTHLDRFALPSAFPLVIQKGQGSRITDVDGNEYIDLSCGYGPHILGYSHPVVSQAIAEAAMAGSINALGNPAELDLAEQIAGAFEENSMVVLSNSGTEAVVMALRIARAHTGKDRIAKFEGHYHGFTDQGMVSSWFRQRGSAMRPDPVEGSAGTQRSVVDQTLVLQTSEPISLQRIEEHAHELAAVIIEPMPAALAEYDAAFLTQLREVCTRNGIVLIFDEIVTGFRVAYGGAQSLAGVRPDLTCLGKIIGGGLPCGAVVGRPEVMEACRTTGDPFKDVETRGFVGGTMSGNSITAAAGYATLKHLHDHPEIYSSMRDKSDQLREGLQDAAAARGVPCRVKGRHSLFSITFDFATPKHIRDKLAGTNMKANLALSYYMRQHGVYVPELHTLMLNDAHTSADLDEVVAAFSTALDQMINDGLFSA